jgi:hypothetical protein
VGTLTKNVDNYHDRVISMGLQKLDDEVNRDRVPPLFRNLGQV